MAKKTAVMEEQQPQAEAQEIIETMVSIAFKPAPPRQGHYSRRVDVARLTHTQLLGLHLLTSSLDAAGATVGGVRRVVAPADAVRWLLEKIGEQRPDGWKPEGF